ncbi:MAG TPA: hypothetical protein VFQ23_16590 [Anaerolineales bacterium]|nr:hypothetical protein [Anaerolineales bacterium]
MNKRTSLWMLAIILLTSCLGQSQESITPTPSITSTQTLIPPTLTSTPTNTPSPTETNTVTPEPFGCLKPPDDYTQVEVNNSTLNQRTLSMLGNAQALYGGEIELTGHAITQGSYSNNVAASFGTHSGGGAVDLSVLQRGTYTVLWDDIEPVLRALRAAGFAAWLREYGELHPDSPIHIHAIAIGDQELSPAAQEQLIGEAGYFRGFSGLPVSLYGPPTPDRYGGPVICQWMIDLGYRDLR